MSRNRRAVIGRISLLLALAALPASPAPADDSMFPFMVSYQSPHNATNLSESLHRPAGKYGFIRAARGHLENDAGRIRFWGTNLCFDACFPTHEAADKLAERLARFGINVVRMHHMDARSIWGDSPNKTTIDPKQLERLDYLIAALKKNGIYINLNLHVSRSFGEREGFVAQKERPKYDKGLDNFEPRMIALQKKYARDLLTHVNPYTRTAYSDEPAIAFVEINNENALFTEWSRGHLDTLPEPYATTFRRLWCRWLRDKYGSTERLRSVWSSGAQPLGREHLTNGDFRKPLGAEWNLERDPQTDVSWSIVTCKLPGFTRCLRAVVRRQGREPWRPQFSQSGFAVKKGRAYTLSFWVRSDADRILGANCMMAHEPWERLGFATNLQADSSWRNVQFTFVADRDDPNARVTLTGLKPGTYEFTGISLRPGGVFGLKEGESLEAENIAVLRRGNLNRTPSARRDFIDFMWDTENRYWSEMYRYLKEELGVHALVSGTQLSYSPVHIQSQLDYIDAHAYWQHPRFPHRPWDRNDWYIVDTAMVNELGGTLTRLAGRRVFGKPFTVSEYNHPAPNSYAAEGLPMLAAMGAVQDWDAVYSFTYSNNADFEPTRLTGYFDIKGDPAKLVHMPAAVALFVRGDLAPFDAVTRVPLSVKVEREKLYETGDPWRLTADEFGAAPNEALSRRVALDLTASTVKREGGAGSAGLIWTVAEPKRGKFVVSTQRTKLFTGFVDGETIDLGEVGLHVGDTRLHWATVSMTCIDGMGFSEPGRIVIAASGLERNTNARLERLGDERITLRSDWGESPLLCEGIPATVQLPVPSDRVECYALDEAGNRRERLRVERSPGGSLLRLGPKYRTLWYEAVIR